MLGRVISKLGEAARATHTTKAVVPYRDSKLTRLLKQSLGGNALTAILCTATAAPIHHDETVSTLKFGQARRVFRVPCSVFHFQFSVVFRFPCSVSVFEARGFPFPVFSVPVFRFPGPLPTFGSPAPAWRRAWLPFARHCGRARARRPCWHAVVVPGPNRSFGSSSSPPFGQLCKTIKNKPTSNVAVSEKALLQVRRHIVVIACCLLYLSIVCRARQWVGVIVVQPPSLPPPIARFRAFLAGGVTLLSSYI